MQPGFCHTRDVKKTFQGLISCKKLSKLMTNIEENSVKVEWVSPHFQLFEVTLARLKTWIFGTKKKKNSHFKNWEIV
jgi:hypothetical protein